MWWLIALVVTCLVYYSRVRLRYFSSRGVRTLPPLPFLGNLTAATFGWENFVETIQTGYDKFKDQRYFGLYQYHVPTVVPTDPELIRQIMVRDFNSFSDRGVHIETDCDPLFGRNLIMLKGPKWRSMRTAISPGFSASRCRSMAPLMVQCARAVITHLSTRITSEQLMDLNKITTAYVNDVIASCAFGFAVNSLEDPDNCLFRLGQRAVIQDTTQVMKLFGYENMKTFMKFLRVKMIPTSDAEKFCQLFKSTLDARRNSLSHTRLDFIQTLVEATQGKLKQETQDDNNNNSEAHTKATEKFTDDDLVAQAVLFYIAGYDTTANLTNYFIYEMASNPHLQEKLLAELDQLPDDNDIEDIYETVQSLEYLEMCMCEVLRLWPLVASADRRSVATYDYGPPHPDSKQTLVTEPGVHIWLPIYSIHRDSRYWENPEVMDPERFAPEKKAAIAPYTYLPFGTGPRHCIGSRFAVITSKVFIVNFFRNYSVRAFQSSARLAPRAFILRPANGFNIFVEPRK